VAAPIELLELSRAVGRTVELLERQAPALAEVMHVALFGYARQTTPAETYEVTWLHRADAEVADESESAGITAAGSPRPVDLGTALSARGSASHSTVWLSRG